ncbi:MAG: M20/M25/M40 family metallo-hydrolase [Halanaerobiales bacterium]
MKNNNLIKKFIELVEIDSISKEERKMADNLKEELKKLGLEVKEDDTAKKINGNAGNLIAYLKGNSSLPTIIFSAHMDRVEPGKGIETIIEDGYIYSKGETVLGGDDVIGIVSILELIRELKEKNIDYPNIIVVFSVAEEIGLLGAKNLDQSAIKEGDYAFVLDVDGEIGEVVNKAPSQKSFNAIIKGKTAHAGMEPEKGVNAIKIASHAISSINIGRIDEETTANIGVIRGGLASNIVPDLVELEGEVRSHKKVKLNSQINNMKKNIDKYVNKLNGEVNYKIEDIYENYFINEGEKIIEIAKKGAKMGNLNFKLKSSGGGSDANIFNLHGIDAINLAIGMENVHSSKERVKIDNLIKLKNYLLDIIKSLH